MLWVTAGCTHRAWLLQRGACLAKVGAILKALKMADEQKQVKPGQMARMPNLCPVAVQTHLEAKLVTR